MNTVIAQLLLYSFNPVSWKFDELTAAERKIIGSQKALDEIRVLVESEVGYCAAAPQQTH